MFEVTNVSINVNDLNLVNNLNLKMNSPEIHVLMGPNGVGKSSIASSIMGNPDYEVKGSMKYNGEEITKLNIYERAKLGIYLINQTPIAIEGVTNAEMLRLALSEKTGETVNIFEFSKELENICESLELDKSFIHKEINMGASGGERKKIELLHLWVLKPSFIILDEIDSGLDVDALKVVGKSLAKYYEEYKPLMLIITHSNTLINFFKDYQVHILEDKKIIKSGGKELAKEVLSKGFKSASDTFVIREKDNYE